jgi:uncharacterized protein (TIGR03437 family)
VNGAPVPIYYAAPGQLGVQMPTNLTGTSASVQVSVNGQNSSAQTVAISPFAPGIFSINSQGWGQGAVQVANSTIFVAPDRSIPGSQARRTSPGEFLTIYATGLGQVSPPIATGALPGADPPSTTTTTPQVMIGGIQASLTFSGLVPGNAGLYQVNVQVPDGVPYGWGIPIVLSIGGVRSNTVTIAMNAPLIGRDNPTVLQGNAGSANGFIYGQNFFPRGSILTSVTGGIPLTSTGVSGPTNQTVYSTTGSGGGKVSCLDFTGSDTIGDWTGSVTLASTIRPAIPTLAESGGGLSGTYTYSIILNVCGITQNASGNGTVNGRVNPGGSFVANFVTN